MVESYEQWIAAAKGAQAERCRYFPVPGAHLFTVLHQVDSPALRVLLVGPLAHERHNSYHPWVRWARYLAARQVEVLRFDYRGVGESSGIFEELSFEQWTEDLHRLVRWFADQRPSAPLLVHGLETGALLAASCFDEQIVDGLLLWSPPKTAQQMLRSHLMYWAGLEQLFESPASRRSTAEYIQQLESGRSIEVDGYVWSSRLWRDAALVELPSSLPRSAMDQRPVRICTLDRNAAPLVRPHLRYDELRDLTWLYEDNFKWIAEAFKFGTSSHDRKH